MLGRDTSLRFGIGERVCCRVSQTDWAAGTVVALNYREDLWPDGRVAPYQVQLDGENAPLIYAPFDDDNLIRAEATFEQLEYEDNKSQEQHSVDYRDDVIGRYPRKHPELFEPSELPRFLDPRLRVALDQCAAKSDQDAAGTLQALWTEESRGLYALPFFTLEYCQMLSAECEHFEEWCSAEGVALHRPNTMNNHGAILDDFGMEGMMQELMLKVVQPLSKAASFGDVGGDELRTHHAFLVAYAMGKDLDLSFHVDSSDVTLNVCLGKEFEGGGLFFRGVRCRKHQQGGADEYETTTYAHRPGVALLHRGHHRHGAHKITSGERHNLILWCRADPKERQTSEGDNAKPHVCQPWCWRHGIDRDDDDLLEGGVGGRRGRRR